MKKSTVPVVCPNCPKGFCVRSIVLSIWKIFKSSSSKAISPQNTAKKEKSNWNVKYFRVKSVQMKLIRKQFYS